MKKQVVFFPASIRSHVIPAMYLAHLLKNEYEACFLLGEPHLKDLVEQQGYTARNVGPYQPLSSGESSFLKREKGKVTFLDMVRAIKGNLILEYRKQELKKIIDHINPSAIFIDIFCINELFAIYENYGHLPILFINPMLSTYKVEGYPAVMEGFWPSKSPAPATGKPIPKIPWRQYFLKPGDSYIRLLYSRQFKLLMKKTGLDQAHPPAANTTHVALFENFPECIMAPLELEFSPEVRRKDQVYFGLSTLPARRDTELDSAFDGYLDFLKERKKAGERIVYLAFGTYYQGDNKQFVRFIQTAVEALRTIPGLQVVVSVNQLVISTIIHLVALPSFIRLFTRVPQLEVLKVADLHITHGGMGSIKESIFYAVPMLVYPLEPRWDNNGNSLKIEFHKLGLSGSLHWERPPEMRSKVEILLNNPEFKNNCTQFREKVLAENSEAICKQRLLRLIAPKKEHPAIPVASL